MRRLQALLTGLVLGLGAPLAAQINSWPVTTDAPYQVRYASNLTSGDAIVNMTNTGANGNSLFGPGFGSPEGNICVNVYAFSPDEQLISCCSCLVTPNGLVHVTANNDLISNTLTGLRPDSIVIKLVTTSTGSEYVPGTQGSGSIRPTFDGSSCTNSAALAGGDKFQISIGLLAWGTTTHSCSTSSSGIPGLNLPPGQVATRVTASPTLSLPAYDMVQFPGLAPGFDVNGIDTYLGWCANFHGTLVLFPSGPGVFSGDFFFQLYNTYGPLPANATSPFWPNVNYLLNHKGGASVAAIQQAVWRLLGGQFEHSLNIPEPPFPPVGAQALVDDALLNGNGFVPGTGQVVAVLLDAGGGLTDAGQQSVIIEVPARPEEKCITETPFIPSKLHYEELKSITNRCANIIGNGSTFGQCKSCRLGGLGGSKK